MITIYYTHTQYKIVYVISIVHSVDDEAKCDDDIEISVHDNAHTRSLTHTHMCAHTFRMKIK